MVGAGIAGLGAARALARAHDVEVFEHDTRAGGHANTVRVAGAGGGPLDLDTGFLVHNVHNYPRLTRLFRELGVRVQNSDMSFSVSCERTGLEYAAVRLWSQPRALVHPAFARLLREIIRFLRTATNALERRYSRTTLGEYVLAEGYSRAFRDLYLVPFTSALWLTAPAQTLDFPVSYAVRFFQNHGLLGFRRHQWLTVVGGSRTYVDAIAAPLGERLHLGTPVREVRRDADGVAVRTADDTVRRFDAVVIAAHAPQALGMLSDADDLEREVLGAFRTTTNSAVLHTDVRLLPRRPRARASWNYLIDAAPGSDARPTVTYYLNKLQMLDEPEHYCVTLNRDDSIDPERVIRRFEYAHPLYTFASLAAQSRLPSIDGRRRTFFCGAYQGFGFHEDGLASGLRAAAGLGAPT